MRPKRKSQDRGRLHADGCTLIPSHALAPVLPEFLKRYPDIKVELSVTDRIIDLIDEHADVTIRAGSIGDMPLSARKLR
jgi:DNA-binding transcriptional LysR family regulator